MPNLEQAQWLAKFSVMSPLRKLTAGGGTEAGPVQEKAGAKPGATDDDSSITAGSTSQTGTATSAAPVGGPGKDPNEPDLTPEQRTDVHNVDMKEYREVYDAALQGTSGKSSDPQKAAAGAQAVAEEAVKTKPRRVSDLRLQRGADEDVYQKFFLEAVQGVAGGNDSPSTVIQKAHAMSLQSLQVLDKEVERLEWQKATLPQPMAPDCEVVHGKVPGPKNHVLCKTHDHVLDTDQKMVIAHSVDEYKTLFPPKRR